ncbi:hypothetical protein ACHAW6_007429, partial [Cyclotella cf. meneghiniana]
RISTYENGSRRVLAGLGVLTGAHTTSFQNHYTSAATHDLCTVDSVSYGAFPDTTTPNGRITRVVTYSNHQHCNMIFPIFRSLQRSMAPIGTRTPAAMAATNAANERFPDRHDDDDEKREQEEQHDEATTIRLPRGHHAVHKTDDRSPDDPTAWPVHSQRARRAREEFVRDGFRRLYAAGSGRLSSFRPANVPEDDGMAAAVRELGGRFGRGADDGGELGGEVDGVLDEEKNWMCLPQ